MSRMILSTTISDASMLHWNTKSVTSYFNMFGSSGVKTSGKYPTFYHMITVDDEEVEQIIDGKWDNRGSFTPGAWNEDRTEFTKGTWNDDGTFTPSE